MWKCPECGRQFEQHNQKHACIEPPETIDEYITMQPEGVQSLLMSVRDALREALPGSEERISWRMPTFWKKRNIIHFTSFKNHMGIYPGEEAIAHFADKLSHYRTSKGAVQFPYDKTIPLELIVEIAKWCNETGSHH